MKKTIFLACLAAGALLTACNTKSADQVEMAITDGFEVPATFYNADDYWTETYDTQVGSIVSSFTAFTHTASADEYNGVVYKAWRGFTFSKAVTPNEPDLNNLVDNQWGAAMSDKTARVAGADGSMGYLLGFWDSQENTETIPEEPCCAIAVGDGVQLEYVYINNSNYAYWAMLKGTAFSKAFDEDDWFSVDIIGVKNGARTGLVTHYLAKRGKIQNTWEKVNLRPLGDVDYIYFQLHSSDTGQWGMNTPAYFCLDNLFYTVKY